MKVFVSSTYRDLKRDRAAVAEVLNRIDGVKAVRMEDFFATHHPPIKECLDRLADCDAVVLLLGSRYGWVDRERGLSATEVEYRTATELGLLVFPFVKKRKGVWQSAEQNDVIKELHKAFKERVEKNSHRVVYQTVPELKYQIEAAIHNYRSQQGLIGVHVPAFQTPGQFFHKYADRSAIFNHSYPLIGRHSHLNQLIAFPSSPQRVHLLTGRGGTGKTRLLKEALDRIAATDGAPSIRVIREGFEFTAAVAKQLPAGLVLIVADDAHRLDGLQSLLAVAQQYPQRIKLMLIARPHGLSRLKSRLVEAGFGTGDVEQLPELGDLSQAENEQLAREVLGPPYAHYADALVAVSRDAPLVTIVGGRLLVEERIPPAMLANSDAFRFQVFDKLAETYTDAIPNHIDRRHARKVLDLISALAPFRPDQEALIERAAAFLGLPVHEFNGLIAELERVGVIRQLGFSLRIAPDVLSDYFLQQACLGIGGQPTTYADDLFTAFWPLSLNNLLRNLSELDWRIRQEAGGTTLLARLWHDLRETYAQLQGYNRFYVVNAVAAVAYLQPRRTLEFARFVFEHLDLDTFPNDEPSIFVSARDNVLRKLSTILKATAQHDFTIRESLDLLWQLRSENFDEPRQQPEHPIRILQELAEFEFEKPVWVYETVLDRIAVWLHRADAFQGQYSPLEVLDGLLKREGSQTWTTRTQGLRIHWQDFQVQVLRFGPYRQRALDLLDGQSTRRTDPRERLRVLKSLSGAVWSSHQLAGKEGGAPDELDARMAENTRILQVIENILTRATGSMFVLLAADELRGKVIDRPLSPREANLRTFLTELPNDERSRLTHHLWQGPSVRRMEPGPIQHYDEWLEATRAEAEMLARGLLSRCQTAEAIKGEIESILADVTSYGLTPEPGPFLAQLVETDSNIGKQLADLVIVDPGSLLVDGLVGLVLPLRQQDPQSYEALLKRMADSSDANLVRLAVLMISRSVQLTDLEIAIVSVAAKSEAPSVVSSTIQVLRPLLATNSDIALRLATEIDLGDDPYVADHLCQVLFDYSHDTPAVDLSDGVVAALLAKFVALQRIGESQHHLRAFVDWLSTRDPIGVGQMFLKRIRQSREYEATDYQPVPYASFWILPTRSANPVARQSALRLVRDAVLDPDIEAEFWLSNLFVAIAGGWDDTSFEVLSEWVQSGDSKKIVKVARLLREADPDFVFNHEAFTVKLLEASDIAGAETLDAVNRDLHGAASSRGGSGTPGEPMPFWIELRDRARESSANYPPSSAAALFYASLEKDAKWMIEHDRKSWEEDERFW